MSPSIFTVHTQLNGSHDLVETFKIYAPLGLRLRCIEANDVTYEYTIAYDHTLHEYMYYCKDITKPMRASWRWLGTYNSIFKVTHTPTLPLQKLH